MAQITIIGLGLIGTSIGLALKDANSNNIIVGHDKDGDITAKAKQRGAVDKTHWNLINACDEADLIILALPAAGIRPTLEALQGELKPGAMIMDTATIKTPVLKAAEVLGDEIHFVGSNPILASSSLLTAADASPDLFKNIPWAICAMPETAASAVGVASDLVTALGATPVFLDAAEHDGLVAAVDGLPMVMAAALMNTVGNSSSWREIRRMAGSQFGATSYLPDFEPEDLGESVIANASNIVHWLDLMIEELNGWKEDLRLEEGVTVNKRFEQAIDRRAQWLKMRERGDWEGEDRPMDAPSFWRRMIGGRNRRASGEN